jgi:hypothetical protein
MSRTTKVLPTFQWPKSTAFDWRSSTPLMRYSAPRISSSPTSAGCSSSVAAQLGAGRVLNLWLGNWGRLRTRAPRASACRRVLRVLVGVGDLDASSAASHGGTQRAFQSSRASAARSSGTPKSRMRHTVRKRVVIAAVAFDSHGCGGENPLRERRGVRVGVNGNTSRAWLVPYTTTFDKRGRRLRRLARQQRLVIAAAFATSADNVAGSSPDIEARAEDVDAVPGTWRRRDGSRCGGRRDGVSTSYVASSGFFLERGERFITTFLRVDVDDQQAVAMNADVRLRPLRPPERICASSVVATCSASGRAGASSPPA